MAVCRSSPLNGENRKEQSSKMTHSGPVYVSPAPNHDKFDEASPRKVTSEVELGRRVTFSKKILIRQVLHINDMSLRVRERYWLTEEEHAEIKLHCKETVWKMMRQDPDLDEEDGVFFSRGLECRTREGQKEKNKRKEAVKRAVLLQQELQMEEGIVDPEFLAAVSMGKTRFSLKMAQEAGQWDAEEAARVFEEDIS